MSGPDRSARLRALRVGSVVLFVLLVAEAVALSPPARPDQAAWVARLLTGDWAGEEPLLVVLFQLMGIWPFVLAAMLAPRLRSRPVPLWPFAAGSLALGAFVLLPGVAMHGEPGAMARWQHWVRAPAWLAVLGLVAAALVGWGIVAGSPPALVHAFSSAQFVHVMSVDFVALWLLSVLVARSTGGPWGLSLVPLFGGLAWVVAVERR